MPITVVYTPLCGQVLSIHVVHPMDQVDNQGVVVMTHRAAGRAGQLPCRLGLLLQGSDAPVPGRQLHTATSR